jgi:hypothetical protein
VSPHGVGEGAVKNATHNVDQTAKNLVDQAAAQTSGYSSPGNSRILQNDVDVENARRAALVKKEQELKDLEEARRAVRARAARALQATGEAAKPVSNLLSHTVTMPLRGAAAGWNAGEAINRAQEPGIRNKIAAGLNALAVPATAAPGMLRRIPGIGKVSGLVGPALTGAAHLIADEPEGHAAGGAIKGYAGRLGSWVKAIGPAAHEIPQTPLGKFKPIPTQTVKLSDALDPHQGKYLGLTQSDNFGVHGGAPTDNSIYPSVRMGGTQFPNFQNIDPRYQKAGVVWANDAEKHAQDLINNSKINGKDVIWSNYIGAPDQLKSNKTVFKNLMDEFYKRPLTDEQAELINDRIKSLRPGPNKPLVFPQSFDIRDKFALQELGGDTFDRRSALAKMLGQGVGVGGTKKGIFLPNYEDILAEHRDPLTVGKPTSSIGTRLFSIDPSKPVQNTDKFHPDYNYVVFGKDQGVQFEPQSHKDVVPDWYNTQFQKTGLAPHGNSWFSYMKNPQEITKDYLADLRAKGLKQGGLASLRRAA